MSDKIPFPTNFDGLQGAPSIAAVFPVGKSVQQVGDMNISGTFTASSLTQTSAVQNNVALRGSDQILGKVTGVNLNSVAATTLFTTPASGFTRCIVTNIIIDNFSLAATTVSISYGQSATPTDWAATATMGGAATAKFIQLFGGVAASGSAFISSGGVNFVANVTIAQGAAATADITVWGYYE